MVITAQLQLLWLASSLSLSFLFLLLLKTFYYSDENLEGREGTATKPGWGSINMEVDW